MGSSPIIGSDNCCADLVQYTQMPSRSYSSFHNRGGYKPRSIKRVEKKVKRNLLIIIGVVLILGYLLLTWGLPTLIGGLSIFHKSTPSVDTHAIADDTALAPPVFNIPYEATNTATIKVSGYAASDMKVEVYIDNDLKTTADTHSDGSFESSDITLSEGANYLSGKTVDGSGKQSLSSKPIKVVYNNAKPTMELSEPNDGKEIKGGDKKVKVSGKTDPQNVVTINGATVIINYEGAFSVDININEGENKIVVVTTNSVGNSVTAERKVIYTP